MNIFSFILFLSFLNLNLSALVCNDYESPNIPQDCLIHTTTDEVCCYVTANATDIETNNIKFINFCRGILKNNTYFVNFFNEVNTPGVNFTINTNCGLFYEENSPSPCGKQNPTKFEDCSYDSNEENLCCYFKNGDNAVCDKVPVNEGNVFFDIYSMQVRCEKDAYHYIYGDLLTSNSKFLCYRSIVLLIFLFILF
jgi:hypothetical protein